MFLNCIHIKFVNLINLYIYIYIYIYNIINHKHILTKYYNHQEHTYIHTYCYLGGYKNTMPEQNLLKQITKIKMLKEERKVKKEANKVIMTKQ